MRIGVNVNMSDDKSDLNLFDNFIDKVKADPDFRLWIEEREAELAIMEPMWTYEMQTPCRDAVSKQKDVSFVEYEYTDSMWQNVVESLQRLQVTDVILVSAAKKGDLDTVLNCVEGLQLSDDEDDRRLAANTAYMVPMIKAWREQLKR
jgi:hypothetical protein